MYSMCIENLSSMPSNNYIKETGALVSLVVFPPSPPPTFIVPATPLSIIVIAAIVHVLLESSVWFSVHHGQECTGTKILQYTWV